MSRTEALLTGDNSLDAMQESLGGHPLPNVFLASLRGGTPASCPAACPSVFSGFERQSGENERACDQLCSPSGRPSLHLAGLADPRLGLKGQQGRAG